MIHIDKNTYIPRVDETLGTLRMHNSLQPIFVDFDKIMMLLGHLQLLLKDTTPALYEYIGKPAKVDVSGNMKMWLMQHEDVSGFEVTKEGISLEKNSVQQAMDSNTLSPLAIELLELYQKISGLIKVRGSLVSLLQNPISDAPSCDGHRMLIVKPEWAPQNTGRVAMRNPAVQNLPRVVQEIITVPKGFVLLHTDSGQIEPRVVYSAYIPDPQIQALINMYNDAYFGVLHYVQMDYGYIASGTTSFTPMEITDEMKDGRKRLKTFNNGVMYGSTSNPTGDRVKAALIDRIGGHPMRKAWIERIKRDISMGKTVVQTAFGTPIDVGNSAKLTAGGMRAGSVEEEMVRLMINNPIQGTAADMMRVSVYEANRIMMNKARKSFIKCYIHDAGVFAIHEDDYDAVSDELATIVSYHVDGWIPINAEPEFGRDGGKAGLIPDLY